jgi:phage terminase large subunit-like protein
MPPRRKVTALTTDEMLGQLAEGLTKQARLPNIHAYHPHEKQIKFHSSNAKRRLYIGGNRSGKTTAGVAEMIWYARGQHPYKRVYEPPVQLRVIGVDFKHGVGQILVPQYKRWVPPSMLKGGSWDRSFNNDRQILTLVNGSEIEFMSYEQELDKFAGVPRHAIHFDEEPPMYIYNENVARLIDYNGDAWFTMTPVEGMTWVYDQLYLPAIEHRTSQVFVVEAHMQDNPHINQKGVMAFVEDLKERGEDDAANQRLSGQFIQLGGLVFPQFDADLRKDKLFIKSYELPPKSWTWYESMDHGFKNPTAWLWHAVSPENEVVTFWEEYASERIVKDWARIVHERRKSFGKIPELTVGDPSIAQHNGITGTSVQIEYSNNNIFIMPGNNDVSTGINQMHTYLRTNKRTGLPYWRITENCPNLIREMSRLRWKTFAGRKAKYENNPPDQIHKKDDHAPDSARYFFTCLPDLAPLIEEEEKVLQVAQGPVIRYDEALVQMSQQAQTPWKVYEGTDLYALESD